MEILKITAADLDKDGFYIGEIALTREQTIELIGADLLAEAEQYEAERRAEQMEGV